jgi:acyl-CoA synthetase (NDP forming)/GNAT superfamily N-acetyltransferase
MNRPATRPWADILLADGSPARVRQIGPADADAIVRLHARLSERTRYLRYFSAFPRIPSRDLERHVNVDHHEREAFVIELGGEIIAVGQYDRLGPTAADAEVAFVVEDAYQRRGLGSVLLEHLAAAARDEGISNFVADVLPVNATMLRVFADAGYPVAQRFVDGVVHLSFPIAPTSESLAVQRAREHHAEAASISRLLAPRGVAVYGARGDGTGAGVGMLRHLLTEGYPGAVYPVHPNAATVGGLPAIASLVDAEGPVDLAVIAVPAEAVPHAVADCAAAGVRGLVVVSVGFAESGPHGAAAQAALVRAVRGHGMRLVGPNCLGIANTAPAVRLNATLAPRLPAGGVVGLFSQSAALGVGLLAEASRRGVGVSTFVSVGNRADVSGNDLLQYWRDDPGTAVVLLYMETWGDPRKFARVARELARRKPVVALASAARPPALTAVAPGPDVRGVEALFASSGVIRVDTVRELFDVGLVLAEQPLPTGSRLAVVTNAAALGSLAEGAAPGAGLTMAAGYPVDLGPAATAEALAGATATALADPWADAVIAAYAPGLGADWDDVDAAARTLATVTAGAGKPLVAVFGGVVSGSPTAPVSDGRLTGVPVFRGVEEAVAAVGRAAGYATWRRTPTGVAVQPAGVDTDRARGIIAELGASSGAIGADATALLGCYGVPVVPSRVVAATVRAVVEAASEIGFPVAVKLATAPWRHRVDLGAVRLDLTGVDDVTRACDELCRLFGDGNEVIVQPMVAPGVACVVEVVDDPSFWPVVGFGVGGIASELLGDRAWRSAPLTDADAHAMIRAPRAAPLLLGYRGNAAVDIDAVADLLVRVGRLADDHPRLRRLELNPVLARPDGCSVLHATARVGQRAVRPDTGPRRLGAAPRG